MVALAAYALAMGLLAGPAGGGGAPDCPPGEWAASEDAAWLRRAVDVAGYPVEGCTGSAWIARTPLTAFYVWSTGSAVPAGLRRYDDRLPLPTYTDGNRLVWRSQGLSIWVEPGPSGQDVLPGRTALGWLQISTRGLPRRYRRLELMPTPPAVLARCRLDRRLRPACPLRIPRIPGWDTYPRVVEGIFGIQRGGEIPGKPELMRPPRILHVEVAVDPDRFVPFRWPASGAVAVHDGLVREERSKPVLLGAAAWGGRQGSVALAPGYPVGGSQGNHVMFRWREGGETFVVGLHAWEPFTEAYATLRRIVASLPRR